jgi:hypothetical protein
MLWIKCVEKFLIQNAVGVKLINDKFSIDGDQKVTG